MADIIVPAESYYVMGDPPLHPPPTAATSAPWKRSLIYGKAVFVYWPARDAGVVK